MGVQFDFFISESSRAGTYDGSSWPADDRVEWKGMTSLGLTTLWAIVDDRERDVETLDGCENLLTVDEERLTARIPDEIVHALSEAEASTLDWVAERWIATEEPSVWSAPERRRILESLARLSRRALETRRTLYVRTDCPFDVVSERARARRGCGIVTSAHFARQPGSSERACADRIAGARGFMTLGPSWHALDVDAARRVLRLILEKDLAYGADVMTAADAAELAEQWLSLTAEPRAFFTNGRWAEPRSTVSSFSPLSASTFDAGVVAVDARQIIMLWVQDED